MRDCVQHNFRIEVLGQVIVQVRLDLLGAADEEVVPRLLAVGGHDDDGGGGVELRPPGPPNHLKYLQPEGLHVVRFNLTHFKIMDNVRSIRMVNISQ